MVWRSACWEIMAARLRRALALAAQVSARASARVSVPCAVMLATAIVLCGGTVVAQSVDYGALEATFGEPVTTSVTGKPQRATDAPANIEIITQDDIRRSGAIDIPGVLRFVTGLDVRQDGLAGADVGIRGYNQASNPHLMVLVDGRQVYMVDYGRIIWAAIPVQLDEIRQIEVVKGPNSALYGFNAVGGVINIITYDPLKDKLDTATARAGTQSYLGGSVIGTGQIGDTAGLRLSAGGFNAQDFPPGALGPTDSAARQSPYVGSFNANSRWQITPQIEAFGDLSFGVTRLADQQPPGVFGTEHLNTGSIRVGADADTRLGLFSLSVSASDVRDEIGDFNGTAPVEYGEEQSSTVVQASDLVKLGTSHTVRLGLEYRVDADDSAALAGGTISNAIAAASLMWDWQVAPSVTLTNAVRVDAMQLHHSGTLLPGSGLTNAQYDSTTLTEPSFNSGIVWQASDDDTFRVSLARGVQLPTLLQYGLGVRSTALVPPTIFLGRPDLNPAIVWNAELDYDRALSAIGSMLSSAVFVQQTDDVIAWPFGTPLAAVQHGTPIFFSQNVGNTDAAGAELEIKGHSESGFRWIASYAFVATSDHTSLDQGPILTSIVEYAHSTPNHVVIGGIGYSRDKLELDLLARWQSSYLDYRVNAQRTALLPIDIDNYVTMTARVGYRLSETLTLALTAQQFNQSQLIETAGPPVERQIIASITVRL
jgi:outer membrane receptor for ferrienterochelin and colicins